MSSFCFSTELTTNPFHNVYSIGCKKIYVQCWSLLKKNGILEVLNVPKGKHKSLTLHHTSFKSMAIFIENVVYVMTLSI